MKNPALSLQQPHTSLRGELTVPGDKSISHRAVMFGSLAEGTTEITHFLAGADCLSTIDCFRKMGIAIDVSGETVRVHGKGLHGLKAPQEILDCGNSGTTMRLLAGVLAGQPFLSELTGDDSIQKRPMNRVITPLRQMEASIRSHKDSGCAPLTIQGCSLHGTHYDSPVASAQVKSCVLLAGLYADSVTTVTEPALSRDHTERLLQQFGAELQIRSLSDGTGPDSRPAVSILPDPLLTASTVCVPGDISSAAYFLTAASLVPGSEIVLKNVGINPTRDGILRVLQDMDADISVENVRLGTEPSADLIVRYASLHGTTIAGDLIPSLIDEIPILAVAAAAAEGTTVIRDAAELKVKESDRIALVVSGLQQMGADAEATEDGMIIRGGNPLHGAVIDTRGDHRLAMSFAVASLIAEGELTLTDPACVAVSYPGFFTDLQSLLS